ncbi:hypothetical protein A3D78_01180 [Candidatus Gottesmanbacteria bacterium RIFCSPHIGHO2_02_FULL_39_14]|uniref:Glycosyl transferase family 1 domain-containing protein n=2 Tax=Candidatus Gottesmaniibacteriota TaxID=1752720 RepID=A0A1F5ZTZ1_9BACT|nr:MAG: hypothetical protein A3D78_01180 [Candidatus Gottesmanbacteria bacterium RIFCSPHIGHO2_02_FULL_39_14]OGG32187.1 MAG: hypothetical protein A3I51_05420 [Candidatus Gottesmanbacteria bacterium RIFCSPLOWO2_02_FULL_38_8]
MIKRLVYSKHSPKERCGVAYFADLLSKYLSAKHVNGFHGFGKCEELFINMDIFELDESEVSSLLKFINSRFVGKKILLMHDYRFTYLEEEMVKNCDLVINLSGEQALKDIANGKMIELFTPSSIEKPQFYLKKGKNRPLSLTFGFFTPRKKSFKLYIEFYENMLKKYPEWYHIIVASTHVGDSIEEKEFITRLLNSRSILVSDFIPNTLLAELISAANLGVFFYPTGIMQNNMGPMAFFSQGKTVITTYGDLTPSSFKLFTINFDDLRKFDLYDLKIIDRLGRNAKSFYQSNLSWEVFIKKMYSHINKFIK